MGSIPIVSTSVVDPRDDGSGQMADRPLHPRECVGGGPARADRFDVPRSFAIQASVLTMRAPDVG